MLSIFIRFSCAVVKAIIAQVLKPTFSAMWSLILPEYFLSTHGNGLQTQKALKATCGNLMTTMSKNCYEE
jgi:hypothetical protein